MYVIIDQKQPLKAAISALHSAIGSKTQQPMLQQMLLTAEGTQLTAATSNEEMSIRYRLPATIQAPGSCLVPASFFASIVQELPAAPLTLVVPCPTDATSAQLRCRNTQPHIKLSALPPDEFPPFPGVGQALLTMDGELLREVIDQVAYAAADHDTSRPVMEGISLVIRDGQACFVGADAFRLALRRLAVPDPGLQANLILSARGLRALARLLPANGSVHIAFSANGHQVIFQMPQVDVALRLIEGAFPSYGTLLTIQHATRVTVPTHLLAEAVRLLAPFARENGHQLICRVIPASTGEAAALVLEAHAPDLGTNTIRVEDGVQVEGDELTLLVHDGFLAEALAVVPTREVMLELLDARRPLTIKPHGPVEHVSVIMPLYRIPTPAAAAEQATPVARVVVA